MSNHDADRDYERLRQKAAAAVRQLDPGKPMGTELFDALARITVSVAFEAVALRRDSTGNVEVFLVQRREDDTAYPCEWHCPGSVLRSGESEDDVFARLATREFGVPIVQRRFVINFNHNNEQRGHFFSVIYLCEIRGGEDSHWFSVDNLPAKMVGHHRDYLIPLALAAFKGRW